jgi:hypothetical protein
MISDIVSVKNEITNHPTKSLSEFGILLKSLRVASDVQGFCRGPKGMTEISNKSINWTISSVKNEVSIDPIDGGPNDHSQDWGLASETNQRTASACRQIVARRWPTLIDGVPIGGDLLDIIDFGISIIPR